MNPENLETRLMRAESLTGEVIAAAIEVHRLKGPGLLESLYERCLLRELEIRSIPAIQQLKVPIEYKGLVFEEQLRLDLLVDFCIIVELKVVENILPIHSAQLLSYMKLLQMPVGLIINFHAPLLKNGLKRFTLKESLPRKTSKISVISL